jgi:hypothetical protein
MAASEVENSAQVLSCELKSVHGLVHAPMDICYAPNCCVSLLWAAWKVLPSGMQTLDNYASSRCCLKHDTNLACCMVHACIFYETVKIATGWGARKLTGENLKLVWAEFSTLS